MGEGEGKGEEGEGEGGRGRGRRDKEGKNLREGRREEKHHLDNHSGHLVHNSKGKHKRGCKNLSWEDHIVLPSRC
jgi:hypothetical protein